MTTLIQLITSYGYLAIFLGTFLEGETVLITAGFLAQGGYLDLPGVILAAFLGTLCGDQLAFYVGKLKGLGFIESRPHWQRKTGRVFHLLRKHQVLLILGFRFIYGIRTITPFVMGAVGVRPLLFLALNVIAASVWAMAIGSLGYLLGKAAEKLLHEVQRYELWILSGIITTGLMLWVIYWFVSKRRDRE